MSRTKPEAVVRETSPYSIEPGLLAWVQGNCRSGGPFGFPGHAFELGLHLLKARYEFVQQACKRERRTFKPAVFWGLHGSLLSQAAPGKRGLPARGEAAPVVRERIHATVATDLLAWAKDTLVGHEALASMSQAVEVGLLLLRQVEERRVQDEEARLAADLQGLWKAYRA
ncbi:MAG: hypothetical protein WC876_02085 [Candidatus Thermoplasmatota archaeon]|jgi:hypothetical protein